MSSLYGSFASTAEPWDQSETLRTLASSLIHRGTSAVYAHDAATGVAVSFSGALFDLPAAGGEQAAAEEVLRNYLKSGERAFGAFKGEYAFSVEDPRNGVCFLVRDRMGVSPLYYATQSGRLLYASEVRALLSAGVEPRLSLPGVRSFFTFGSVQEPYTFIESIRSVAPGSYLKFDGKTSAMIRYWSFPERAQVHDAREVAEEVRRLLDQAMARRMRGRASYAAFLSGGIDSTAVVALLRKQTEAPIDTFSLIYNDERCDERTWARLAAERNGTRHHEFLLNDRAIAEHVDEVLNAYDQPSHDGTNTWFVSRFAREAGADAAFIGIGGDELFAGYNQFAGARQFYRHAAFYRLIPGSLADFGARCAPMRGGIRRMFAMVGKRDEPYFGFRTLFPNYLAKKLLRPEFLVSVPERNEVVVQKETVNRISALELGNYVLSTALRDGDQMGAAHGLPAAIPLLDADLVSFMLSVEGALKLDPVTPKHLLVAAAGAGLPKECVFRRKSGFVLPFDGFIRGPLRARFEALASGDVCGALSPEGVRELWRCYLQGGVLWTQLWSVLAFDHFCKRYRCYL